MRQVATKALAAVGGLAIVTTVVAVAVADKAPRGAGGDPRRQSERLPIPRIDSHPDPVESAPRAVFRFSAKGAKRFECRLDAARWRPCRSPLVYGSVAAGRHAFLVRSVALKPRRHSRSRRFRWLRAEQRPFSIVQTAEPGPLFPGAPPSPLPVRIDNPNTIPIFVTSLQVSVAGDPPGCDAATNLELIPASATDSAPLLVPAGGSAQLPGPGIGAPSIALRDLPVNQDACQNARFSLVFSGSAHG